MCCLSFLCPSPCQTIIGTANYTITQADIERCCDHPNHIVGCNDNATPHDSDDWDHINDNATPHDSDDWDHINDNATPCPCSVTNEAFVTGTFGNNIVTSNTANATVTAVQRQLYSFLLSNFQQNAY